MTSLRGRFPGFWLFPLVYVIGASRLVAVGQCSSQPPDMGFAVPPGSTVYYAFDQSTSALTPPGNPSDPTPASQIQSAFNAWNSANTASGGNQTQFLPADASHPATVTIKADAATGNAGATTVANAGAITGANPATITFHPQSFLQGSSQNIFQATAPNYGNAYFALALHEIAHLMGIGDYPQGAQPPITATSSVVQPIIGVNDIDDPFPKSQPSPCDEAQATRVTNAIWTAQMGTGGGSGGGPLEYVPPDNGGTGSGSPDPCDPNDQTWDSSTQTVSANPC